MLPIVMVILALGALLLVFLITIYSTISTGQNNGIQTRAEYNPEELRLREAAQKALKAIGSKHKLIASTERAGRGQHVFNNGLLGFHRSVLQDLLRDVGGYDEQLENLVRDLVIPLTQTQQHAISTMVASFGPDEFYVDYNADLFGEFVKELRNALVIYLKAETSDSLLKRCRIQKKRKKVRLIATEMGNHEVYVDPMALERWLKKKQSAKDMERYNQVRDALKLMFQNILQDFQKVSDKIRVL